MADGVEAKQGAKQTDGGIVVGVGILPLEQLQQNDDQHDLFEIESAVKQGTDSHIVVCTGASGTADIA